MKKKYLLYVEDEEFQAKLFAHIIESELADYGYGVITLHNGLDLVNFIAQENELSVPRDQIGLILLDLSIHDISGIQILKTVRRYELEIPIAIFSARDDDEIRKEVLGLGATEYFVKGKNLEELQRLKKYIIKKLEKE